jgi:hypothetical protein
MSRPIWDYYEPVAAFSVTPLSDGRLQFSWSRPIVTGTTVELTPTKYVLAKVKSNTVPELSTNTSLPYYERYGMSLINENIFGGNRSYTLTSTEMSEITSGKYFFGIYPVYVDVIPTGMANPITLTGSMFFTAGFADLGDFDRKRLAAIEALTVNSDGHIYFQQMLPDSLGNNESLLSKINYNSDKLFTLNGVQPTVDANIQPTNSNVAKLVYNNSNDFLGLFSTTTFFESQATLNGYFFNSDSEEVTLTTHKGVAFQVRDAFIYNNDYYIVSNYVTPTSSIQNVLLNFGIYKYNFNLPTDTIDATTTTRTNLVTKNFWYKNVYDVRVTHPTAFKNVAKGQIINYGTNTTISSGFIVIEKESNTSVVLRGTELIDTSFVSNRSFFLTNLQLISGMPTHWGIDSNGNRTLNLNEDRYSSYIPAIGIKGTRKGNKYYSIGPDAVREINLDTGLITNIDPHPFGTAAKAILYNTDTPYILTNTALYNATNNFKVEDILGSSIYAIAWNSKSNSWYFAENRLSPPGHFGWYSDIKTLTEDGIVSAIPILEGDLTGETNNITDSDGDNSGNLNDLENICLGNSGWTACKPPTIDDPTKDDEKQEIVISDPEGNIIDIPTIVGTNPNTVVTFRKLRDRFYLLTNGVVVWTYQLSPSQLYLISSNQYIGWYQRGTKIPVETPPENISYPDVDKTKSWIFDAVLSEAGYSRTALFDGWNQQIGQTLLVYPDLTFTVDRVALDEDIKQAIYKVFSGKKYQVSPTQFAPSPLLPAFIVDLIAQSPYREYLKEIEIDN